jgi:short subunit dehydrogenase-like uncharacterized protein
MSGPVLVYGATGFSGRAIAARLSAVGCDLIVAGRDAARVQVLARSLGAPFRAFDVTDPAAIDMGLAGVGVLLNAAGPFRHTAAPMMDGCFRARAHYLDLTGEWRVFAMAQARDDEARAAGIMLMPGVGFAVAVSDCLMAKAVREAPGTSLLRVAVGRPGVVTRGSLRSAARLLGTVVVRRDGVLRATSPGGGRRSFNFGAGESSSIPASWPDVVTAHRTTGVPNIEGFIEAPFSLQAADRALGLGRTILGDRTLQAAMGPLARVWPDHPTSEAQGRASQAIVVEAVDPWRRAIRFGLRTADGYSVTTSTATEIVTRVLGGELSAGFQTPAGLYGSQLIDALGCAQAYDAGRLEPDGSRRDRSGG